MTLDASTRRRLESERQVRLRQGVEALAAGDVDVARVHNEWIELADRLLATAARRRKRRGAVAVAAVCVLIAVLLMTVRTRHATVAVEVVTDGLALRVGDDSVVLESVTAQGFALSGMASVSLDGVPLPIGRQGEIAGGNVLLRRLVGLPGADLELERGSTGLALFTTHGSAVGSLALRRSMLEVDGDRRVIDRRLTEPPATIAFRGPAGPDAVEPLRLSLSRPGVWRLTGQGATNVHFDTEDPPASGRSRSTIHGGTIRIHDGGTIVDLRRGDSLVLDLAAGVRGLTVADSGDALHVSFEAEVSRVKAGPPRFVSNRNPTIAQYLYRNERLALFWAAAAFLWGLLWSVRNTILS